MDYFLSIENNESWKNCLNIYNSIDWQRGFNEKSSTDILFQIWCKDLGLFYRSDIRELIFVKSVYQASNQWIAQFIVLLKKEDAHNVLSFLAHLNSIVGYKKMIVHKETGI